MLSLFGMIMFVQRFWPLLEDWGTAARAGNDFWYLLAAVRGSQSCPENLSGKQKKRVCTKTVVFWTNSGSHKLKYLVILYILTVILLRVIVLNIYYNYYFDICTEASLLFSDDCCSLTFNVNKVCNEIKFIIKKKKLLWPEYSAEVEEVPLPCKNTLLHISCSK